MPNTFIVDRPTESTHKKIAAALEILAADARKQMATDWESLAEFANTGLFGEAFGIGDYFVENWKDTAANVEYVYPMQLNHIADVELQDGETLHSRPFLQAHYAHPFGVQFSHQRAFLRCPSGLAVGTYYFTIESAWGSNVGAGDIVCFTTTVAVPNGGRVAGCYSAPDTAKSNWRIYTYSADGKTILETITPTFTASGTDLGTMKSNTRNGDLNSCQEMAYGWNRWAYSAIRQYLNSAAAAGGWWTAQDEWDIAPDQLASKAGFLSGWPDDLLTALKQVKVLTYPNTVNDDPGGNTPDVTYDKVFLPSLEQIYATVQKSGEGEYHEYWRRRSGRTSPAPWYTADPNYITYAVENHTSAQYVRLRSAYRGDAYNTCYVDASGYVGDSGASYALRFSPLIVL